MIRNYFLIALRNFRNNKLFSFINIFGLAVGLTCCLLITLYIRHELSYDKYHVNIDRLYQLGTIFQKETGEDFSTTNSSPIAPELKREFPEVKEFTRLMRLFQDDKTLFRIDHETHPKSIFEAGGYMADSTFFQLFTYDFIEGVPNKALM